MPVENMFAFTAVSTDGIERDLILTQSCQVETHPISAIKDIDPQRLMNVLCKSVIYLLGGNSRNRLHCKFNRKRMKTAIIYYSKYGTTERVTRLIGDKLTNKVDYISLKECPRPDIRTYDRIILGTAIYAGSPNRKITQFCHNNQLLLEQKVIGLFICCMNEEQEAEEMNKAFPEFLQRLSIPKAILGGKFQFDKMNFIERFLTKKIAKVNSSVSKLRYDAINEFTTQIKDNHLW